MEREKGNNEGLHGGPEGKKEKQDDEELPGELEGQGERESDLGERGRRGNGDPSATESEGMENGYGSDEEPGGDGATGTTPGRGRRSRNAGTWQNKEDRRRGTTRVHIDNANSKPIRCKIRLTSRVKFHLRQAY